jgi:hypothetical protein
MSKTANNWRGSKPVALEQQLSRRGGGRGLELRSEAAWAYEVAHANTCRGVRQSGHTNYAHATADRSSSATVVVTDRLPAAARLRRSWQHPQSTHWHCSQYAGAGANAALSLPSIRFSTRSRHASFTSIFPKFSPLKSLRKAVGAFSMPCSTLSFHTSLPSRIHPDRS